MWSTTTQEGNNSEYFENVIKIFRKDLICASHVSCLAATQGIWGSRNPNLKTNFEVLIL